MQVLDLNGDGNTDVIYSTPAGPMVRLGDGKGGFSSTPIPITIDHRVQNFTASFIDVNGDGISDEVQFYPGYYDSLCGCLEYSGMFIVGLGDGKGNFTTTTNLEVDFFDGGNIKAADLNADGKLDFAYVVPDYLGTFINKGNGVFEYGPGEALTDDPRALVLGDFDADGKQDVAYIDHTGPGPTYPVHYRYGNGDGTFGPEEIYTIDAPTSFIGVGDFNRDGRSDLVIGLDAKIDSQGRPIAGSTPRLATLLAKHWSGFYWSGDVPFPSAIFASQSSSATFGGPISVMNLNHDSLQDVVLTSFFNAYTTNPGVALLAGKTGGGFGGPQPYKGYLLAPLSTGGLPALFSQDRLSEGFDVQLNTSK